MKLFGFCGILSLALLATARADLTIVQNVEGAGPLHEITIKIKGDKARVEVSPQMTTIVDTKSGEVTNILRDKKTVMRIPGEKAKALAEVAKSFVKEETPNQPAPKPTGKTQTINGYETSEYVSDSPKFHATYWVATNYPDYQKILQQMDVLRQGVFQAISRGMPDYRELPGFPLRTVVKVGDQPEITSTIESVNLAPLPDSDFTPPAGYSEMKLPDIDLKMPARSSKPDHP